MYVSIDKRDLAEKLHSTQLRRRKLFLGVWFIFSGTYLAGHVSFRWRTTRYLASELVKRFKALTRIKAKEFNMDDINMLSYVSTENRQNFFFGHIHSTFNVQPLQDV